MWNERPAFNRLRLIAAPRPQAKARLATLFLPLLLLPLFVFGQARPPESAIACAAAELKQGVVVESVAKNSEGEKAGLAEGDVILSWSRGDLKGEIESPFDLTEIETEQEPRGRVALEGTRGGQKQMWRMGPDKWEVQTRPSLPSTMLASYREGQELAKIGKLSDAAARWRAEAAEAQKYQCSWLSPWFLFHAAETLANAHQWKDSEVLYREALGQTARASSEARAQILQALAGAYKQQSDVVNAEKYQQEALEEIRISGGERLAAAVSLTEIGNIAKSHGDSNKAEEYYRQGLEIRERLAPGSLDLAASLNNLGNVANDRGDLDKAEEYYVDALEIRKKITPGGVPVAASLNSLGNIAFYRGDLGKAEEHYRQALAIFEQLAPGGLLAARTQNNLGNLAYKRGDLDKAGEYYRQALALIEKLAPDSLNVADGLNNLATVAYFRGDLEQAEEYYRQALEIRKKLAPDSVNMAISVNNLGDVAHDRGDLDKAGEYYRQALAVFEKLAPGSLNVAMIWDNLGDLAEESRELTKAEGYYRQALAIHEKLGSGSLDVGVDLNDLGQVAYDRGDSAKAEEFFQQSFAIDEKLAPGSLDVAAVVSNLGRVARDRGDLAKALEYYGRALEIRKNLAPASTGTAESLAALAAIMRDKQHAGEAMRLYAQAIDVLESQLSHLGGSSDARAGFRAKHADYYFAYSDLLLTQRQPELAFQVLERSRARTLLETLSQAHVDIRQGADRALLERERTLRVTLAAKSNRKIDLLQGRHSDEQVAAFSKNIDELLSQYQEVEGQIRMSSPTYAALMQPQPLSAKEVQEQLLDSDTLLLEYALGEKHSLVFAVTPTSLASYELPKRSEIEDTAHHVYDLLTSRNRWIEAETSSQRKERVAKGEAEYRKASATLSQMIIGPFIPQLEGKRLLIVADGELQYIPFGILPVPARDPSKPAVPLVTEHEIVNLPSASVLALLRRQSNGRTAALKEVAVLADPVFDKEDSRVGRVVRNPQIVPTAVKETIPSYPEHLTRSLGDLGLGTRQAGAVLPRLAFSRQEADAIMAMTDPGKGMEALDFQASRETALNKDLGQYRIVHFATHGLLDNEHPELSGLVFSLVDQEGQSRDGFLDLEDIYNLTLPVDLVVLSACETGLGKQITGEGLVGLTRGFMYAGASRVLASLWKVDDEATAEVMGRFYAGMLKAGLPPAAALRQAQIEMQKQKRWTDPYYWAAFTIQGEWK